MYSDEKLKEINEQSKIMLNRLKSEEFYKYTGWMNLLDPDSEEVQEILETAKEIRENSEVLVVVGIGGSYLGARAVIEALSNKYKREIEVIYVGNSLSSLDMEETIEYLQNKDFTVNVISKSGTTMETEVAFEFIKKLLFEKYGEKAYKRIIVTTDKNHGKLRKYSNENGLKSFTIPEDVGGRYSVLTAVGLLPIATAGIDIRALLRGAGAGPDKDGESFENLRMKRLEKAAISYASYRNMMYKEEKEIELLVTNEPRMKHFGEWWQQLFAESEGKNGKGIFPVPLTFSTDLHSIGQLIQEGKRNLFETIITFDKAKDGLIDPISNIPLNEVNYGMLSSAVNAHTAGEVYVAQLPFRKLNETAIGGLIYLLELSCAISSLLIGNNPFDQPGVEEYKKNMRNWIEKNRNSL